MENKYPEYILKKLRQREGLEKDDTSQDKYLNRLSPSEAFNEVCQWEGLIGYAERIKGWIGDIYGFDIDEVKSEYFNQKNK